MQFAVWAPKVDRVEVEIAGQAPPPRSPRFERGWWQAESCGVPDPGHRLRLSPEQWSASARPTFGVAAAWRAWIVARGRS